MTCYFHQNIAYVAFKTEELMNKVCNLRIYADDNTLLRGRPRLQKKCLDTANPIDQSIAAPKPMSTQISTSANTYINVPSHKRSRHRSPTRNEAGNHHNKQADNQADPNIHSTTPDQLTNAVHTISADQFDLLLARLSDLETIKAHLTTLDNKIQELSITSPNSATVAQRS